MLFVLLASRFSVRCALSPLLCFPPGPWLLTGGCPPPPPLSCLAVFVAASRCSVFFFRCAPPLSQAFSGFRPRVPWALALCVVCFPHGRLWRPVYCFVRRRLVWCCRLWCVLCCAWCCVACLCLVRSLRCVAVGLVVLFLLCSAVVRCCVLRWFLFFFVVPCLSVVLRAVSVSVLSLCVAVPVCLRCCSLCVALLPLLRWLVFCVVVCGVCVFAVGPGCPLLSPVESWWVLVSCFVDVLWCVPGCCAAPRCCVSCRLALGCCVLCCFVLLCLVLSRTVSCLGALSVVLWACGFGALFCLVSPRRVCFAVVCCCPLLCFVPCVSWGVVLCVPCPLRPVQCCCASLLSLGARLPCAVPRGAVLPCGVVVSCPAALFVWFLLLAKPLQNWFLFEIKFFKIK